MESEKSFDKDMYKWYSSGDKTMELKQRVVIPKGSNIAFSGRIGGHTRESLGTHCRDRGFNIHKSVTFKTDFLVCNTTRETAKVIAAKSLGIRIISPDEFFSSVYSEHDHDTIEEENKEHEEKKIIRDKRQIFYSKDQLAGLF